MNDRTLTTSVANHPDTAKGSNIPRMSQRARRLLAVYDGSMLPRIASSAPRVAVIGAGLAGLCAAHVLARAGLAPAVFEAAPRVGGRVRTDHGRQEPGLLSEQGGEFIDTTHWDMLALASYFSLPLIDTGAESEHSLETAYYFGDRQYNEADVLAAYADVAPRIARDVAQLSRRVSRRSHTEADRRFDFLSISDYLASLDMAEWLRNLIEVAFVTEYGGDASEQSSINLLSLIGTDLSDGFSIFGGSDERYKIRDGADRITEGLAQGLRDGVYLEHRLLRLRKQGQTFRLALQTPSRVAEIDADAVVLALPFTLLRQVELDDTLPDFKRKAMQELGYGTNSKLLLGMQRRCWRELGYDGGVYTDLSFQTAWDSSRQRAGERGIFTCFLGGREGLHIAQSGAQLQARRFAELAEKVFPGFEAQFDGSAELVHWPTEPYAQGSYTCYRPGQWTSIAGDEVTRVGQLYFAGEHCATDSQGYMNGAAETGRQAAQAIIRRLA
ncbi:flavin monoamine oxidase family protein [Paraburkholderia sp. 32]|uniref:flavin monoamine oxidase family protein n=1 Tax=Paraburkholderia sp. 32 TaxID=2991057 RepID=UPI003D1E45D8